MPSELIHQKLGFYLSKNVIFCIPNFGEDGRNLFFAFVGFCIIAMFNGILH